MANIEMLVPKHILNLEPYHITRSSEIDFDSKTIKLDWNESTLPPSDYVLSQIIQFINKGYVNYYPHVESLELKKYISEYCQTNINCIEIFNGSDCAFEYICRSFLTISDNVIVLQPTYDNFRVSALATGANIKNINLIDPFSPTVGEIILNIDNNTKMIYLVNPNNPTGYVFTKQDILEILNNFKGLLLIDEAYYEFYGETFIELLSEFNNVIIVRSFSKAFGLAGIRLGYVIADPNVIKIINRIRNSKSVNVIAQVAGIAAMRDINYMHKYVSEINNSKTFIRENYSSLGVPLHITPANFFLLKVPNPKKLVYDLAAKSIYVRDRSSMHKLDGYIRVTIGTIIDMKILLDQLKFELHIV